MQIKTCISITVRHKSILRDTEIQIFNAIATLTHTVPRRSYCRVHQLLKFELIQMSVHSETPNQHETDQRSSAHIRASSA